MSSTVGTMGSFTTRASRRPSRAWYGAAAAIILVGLAAGIAWGALATLRTHERAQDLLRTDIPGRLEVQAADGTSMLVFFEGDGKPSPEDLGLTVTGPGGSQVAVQPYDLRMEYEIAGWTGTPIASFSASRAGTYTVAAHRASREGDISIGDDFVRVQALNIVAALGLVGASITLGLAIILVTIVKRSRLGRPGGPDAPSGARKRRQASPQGGSRHGDK
jgi:hypothetical protein